MTVLTFNSGFKGAQITLGNLAFESATSILAYTTSTSGWNVVAGTVSQSSGKYYVEFTVGTGTTSGTGLMVGLGNSSMSTTTWLGNTSNSFGLQSGGTGATWNVSGTPGWSSAASALFNGDRIGFAVDVGNQKYWVRINGGSWLNGDPVAETGGGTWSFAGAVYPAVAIEGQTIPTGMSFVNWAAISGSSHDFSAAPPSGYSPWGTTSSYASGTTTLDTTWAPSGTTFSSGNLQALVSLSGWGTVPANILVTSGQFYFEVKQVNSDNIFAGIVSPLISTVDWIGNGSERGTGYDSSGDLWNNGTGSTGIGPTLASGDIACIAVDLNLKKLWMRKNNGSWYGGVSPNPTTGSGGIDITATIAPYGGAFLPAGSGDVAGAFLMNFGASGYTYVNPFSIVNYTGTLADSDASSDNLNGALTFSANLSDTVISFGQFDRPRTIFDGVARKALTSGASATPLAVAGVRRKALASGGSTSNLAFSGLCRKVLVLLIPSTPLNSYGAIPVFPPLPVGFPVKVSPVHDTIVGTTKSLREMRVPLQTYPIWDIEILFDELIDQTQNASAYAPFAGYAQYESLVQTWLMMYGQAGVFAFDCPWDDSRSLQPIGTGDGVTYAFTVYRTWGQGAQATTAPVGAINQITAVYFNGVAVSAATYTSQRNQIVFNSPPAAGVVITMTFSFYYLCRWTEDEQDYEEFAKNRWTVPSLKFRASPW